MPRSCEAIVPACIQPFNQSCLDEIGVPALTSGADGSNIAIAVIDYGFDILHPSLREPASGRTRFRYIWDQSTQGRAGGYEFDAAALDDLIHRSDLAGDCHPADRSYDPHASRFGRSRIVEAAHGTLMASIAAGSVFQGFRGVAPAAQLLGVDLDLPDHAWKEEDDAGRPTWSDWRPQDQALWDGWRSYDEAQAIVEALDYAHARATALRVSGLVINLSIGAYAGAHDGCSAVERKITEIARRSAAGHGVPCAVVVGTGNAGADDGHFGGEARASRPVEFEWRMEHGQRAQKKLEIWYQSESPLRIRLSLTVPYGASPCSVEIDPGRTASIEVLDTRIGLAEHVPLARAPLSRVRILVHPPYLPSGLQREIAFAITCSSASEAAVPVHAWIEREDEPGEQSTLYPSHPASTLTTLASAEGAIVVAGYDHHIRPHPAVFVHSSLGPAPWSDGDRASAPVVAAPSTGIWGARSKTRGFIQTGGTSAATALTSGSIALLMQRAAAAGQRFDSRRAAEVLAALGTSPREACGSRRAWSPRFGYGALNVRPQLEGALL